MIRTVFGHSKLHPYLVRILNNASSRGITLPSKSYVLILNEVITDFDKNGFWNLLDTFYLFAGGGNTTKEFKCINWINPSLDYGVFFGDLSAAFEVYGLSGNYTTSNINAVYFKSGRTINTGVKYILNDACMGTLCYRQSTVIDASGTAYISTSNNQRVHILTPASSIVMINSGSTRSPLNFLGTGLMILNRTSNINVNGINRSAQSFNTANSSLTNFSGNFTALHMALDFPLAGYNTNAGLSLMFTGQSIPFSISQAVRTTINEKYFRKLGLTEIA